MQWSSLLVIPVSMIIDMGLVLVDLNLTQGISPGTLHFPLYQYSVKHNNYTAKANP